MHLVGFGSTSFLRTTLWCPTDRGLSGSWRGGRKTRVIVVPTGLQEISSACSVMRQRELLETQVQSRSIAFKSVSHLSMPSGL